MMLATAALVLALAPAPPQGTDWPHYRGPDRDGRTTSKNPWSATGAPEPAWSKNVGKGYSSPSIADGRLVTLGFDEAKGLDRVSCLDAATGDEHWRFEFAAKDAPQYHGGGTLSTPTIADGRVYCLNRDGLFHVLSLDDGDVIWSRDYRAETDVARTFHGFSSAPIVDGDRLYVQLGGLVLAAATTDGAIAWRSEDQGDISHANLLPLAANGKPALATIVGRKFVTLATADGSLLHEYAWQLRGGAMHCSIPVAVDADRVFLSTAYNKGCALLELGESAEPRQLWGNRRMRNKVTACVLYDGHLYGFDESMLRCLDLDGNSKWRVRGLGLGSLSIVDDRLLVLNADGELIVAEASPEEFRELSRRKVLDGGVYWTAPVFVDGRIYVRNSLGDLRCLDHRSGDPAAALEPAAAAPAPAELFRRHAESVGGRASYVRSQQALRMQGTWSIPLRGLKDGDMTWLLVDGGAWDQRLDDAFFYAFDGTKAWTIEPQGPRMITGDELFEHRSLFSLPDMLAPDCPDDAVTRPKPVRFADTDCWCVASTVRPANGPARSLEHYFSIADGRLIGRAGEDESTLVLHGSQSLAGLVLPERVTRYRAEDGQEHVMTIAKAEWIAPPPDAFELPPPIARLNRTKEEIARDTAALTKRFAPAFDGRFQDKTRSTPAGDDIFTLRVRDGELWLAVGDEEFRVAVENEKDGVFGVDGPPIRFTLVTGDDGTVSALQLLMGPRKILLPRVK